MNEQEFSYEAFTRMPVEGVWERTRLNQLNYELKMHQYEVSRLKSEIKKLESMPGVLDIPLPFD